jgi:hypothetical protein
LRVLGRTLIKVVTKSIKYDRGRARKIRLHLLDAREYAGAKRRGPSHHRDLQALKTDI